MKVDKKTFLFYALKTQHIKDKWQFFKTQRSMKKYNKILGQGFLTVEEREKMIDDLIFYIEELTNATSQR
jgi:hypothetical protein